MSNSLHIARKELATYFSSPAAFIFLGAFLAVCLFTFFWVETFFARNIADVRPLFEWMPVLLVFLVAALTMRSWSEEMRAGTLEVLLTAPAPPFHFVFGKFLACWALVGIALTLTMPVVLSVAILGPIDWGPVAGAYVATLFLAAAYISIGLFVSAHTDTQIVSLIFTVLICGFFYLLGSEALAAFFGNKVGEFLALLGSGSRFESITRGVLDVRDLYYYVSILGVFLTLNLFSLEKLRWSEHSRKQSHLRWRLAVGLVVANLLVGNVWLQQVSSARVDLTQGKIYSISDATKNYLAQLREPLLIRGYFSSQTHPLLSPLVPKMRDLLEEFSIAGGDKIRIEIINPLENPELEEEASRRYGIQPVPFQTTSKYQAAVTNSYFDVLVKYGDEYEKLGFRDLIEVKAMSEGNIEVELRNPEYDITRAIKKVLYAYQAADDLFINIKSPVAFKGYISADKALPDQMVKARKVLDRVLAEIQESSGGKFTSEIVDPGAANDEIARLLRDEYGFRPLVIGLLDTRKFWFHLTLEGDGQVVQVALPRNFAQDDLKRSIEAGLKRFSRGFLKTVAFHRPQSMAGSPQFGMRRVGPSFSMMESTLTRNARIRYADLKDGRVPEETDLLTVVSPRNLDEKQLFAIDQFLMKGGTVVIATSPFDVPSGPTLVANKVKSGVEEWLKHHGITVDESMVLDRQNSVLPIPIERKIGGFSVREIRTLDYPYFSDIRGAGLNRDVEMTNSLGQVTMSWASPITIDADKNKDRKVTRLLESSEESWTSDSLDVLPDFKKHGDLGFPGGDQLGRRLLGVAVEGRFNSYFKGKSSPMLAQAEKEDEKDADGNKGEKTVEEPVVSGVIERSPESGRIILFASNTFLTDSVLTLATQASRANYLNPLQLVENAIDWSLEDRGLLSIRSRGHFSRTLIPMSREQQVTWEYGNYGMAALGLLIVFAMYRQSRRSARMRYERVLNFGRA